jgi:hypothetical protein
VVADRRHVGHTGDVAARRVDRGGKLGRDRIRHGGKDDRNLLVAAATACADGVEIATMTAGASPTNWRAICAAVAGLPCAVW